MKIMPEKARQPDVPQDIAEWGELVLSAHRRIRPLVLETPVESISDLAPEASVRLLAKLENLQKTGSFKLRGATNKISLLSSQQRSRGVIAASNGNHGLGVASAAKDAGIAAEIYVSSYVSPSKASRMEQFGAAVCRVGETPLEAELAGRRAATESGKAFISPYNDVDVIAGQGTIAVELQTQTPALDAVFVAVGGGGLVGGIGAYFKWVAPRVEVVGCWAKSSPVLYECLRAGQIVDVLEQPTLSESTAGGLEADSITLDLCKRVIDRSVLVSEDEILTAMRKIRDVKGWLVEGAAAVALAAALKDTSRYRSKTVMVIICGGNLSPQVLDKL
ncbi:MAG TPA: threonine/serine dehydratase [Candidatus Angelobacter sp.]|jgi:threonine dehydratase|nr:threonine/serine dehydratase [Candidatus Angelobacter sp.]